MVQNFHAEHAKAKPLRDRIEHLESVIAKHNAAIQRARSKIRKISERCSEMNPFLRSAYLQFIADAVLTQFPGMTAEILGPFGLGNTSTITIGDPTLPEESRDKFTLSFRIDLETGAVSYVDYSKSSGDYPKGSMGAVNGLNHPEVPLTADMTIEALAQLFKPVK